jgi:hypothetical protein
MTKQGELAHRLAIRRPDAIEQFVLRAAAFARALCKPPIH